jgi:hypothetical protein
MELHLYIQVMSMLFREAFAHDTSNEYYLSASGKP